MTMIVVMIKMMVAIVMDGTEVVENVEDDNINDDEDI